MRIVSLLPAATEIVAALGLIDELVGISHECDYPPAIREKPRVTGCEIRGQDLESSRINDWVSRKLDQGHDLFSLNIDLLRSLRPDLILTQELCAVCAPAYGSVAELAQTLPGPPRILNLEPSSLEEVLQTIQTVADATGVPEPGRRLIDQLRRRIEEVRGKTARVRHRPRVAVIEWLDPPFCSGHWTPDLVRLAGGEEVLGRSEQDSVRVAWEDVARAAPEILVIACCGQSADRAGQDWGRVQLAPVVRELPAVQAGKVYVADGNAYFSRPGPRIVDSLEILAGIIHPILFAGAFPDRGLIAASTPAPRSIEQA
jgi:iron complex transport system substrate-binding protein